MGAQQMPGAISFRWQEERIVHFPGRVVRRKIQRSEVMEIVFDLRAFGYLEPHRRENLHYLFDGLANGMQQTFCGWPNRQ